MISNVPLTLEQIVEESRNWPPEKVGELVDRLTEQLHASPDIEEAWKQEARRRLAEIENGRCKPWMVKKSLLALAESWAGESTRLSSPSG